MSTAKKADRYGSRCWELDALNPNVLRQRVEEQIRACLDLPAWERAKEIERVEVESMRDFHATWKTSISGQASKYSGGGA